MRISIALSFLFLGLSGLSVGAPWARGAESDVFSVRGQSDPAHPVRQSDLIATLKQKAILEWLSHHVSGRLQDFAPQVTPEVAEKYVLDYEVTRLHAAPLELQLKVHLDIRALKQWIRAVETKHLQSSIRAGFLFSSTVPTLLMSPDETARLVQDTPLVTFCHRTLAQNLAAFHMALTPTDLGLGVQPQVLEGNELASSLQRRHLNGLLWMRLVTVSFDPREPTQVGLEAYFWNTNGRLLTFYRDLNLAPAQLSNTAQVRSVLHGVLGDLRRQVEELVNKGMFLSQSVFLRVEGVNSMADLRRVQGGITGLDFVLNSTPVYYGPQALELKLATFINAQRVGERLDALTGQPYHFRVLRVDPPRLTVRYYIKD